MRLALAVSLLLLIAAPASAQIAAAVVPPGKEGALQLDAHGNGVFAVVALNLGSAPGLVSSSGRCGGFEVHATGAAATRVCVLDTATGACAGPALEILPVQLEPYAVGVYGILVFGPAGDRVTVTFTEYTSLGSGSPLRCEGPHAPRTRGPERGSISVAVLP